MKHGLYLVRDVAKQLGVRPHQLNYAIWSGRLAEPHLRIRNIRLWDDNEVRAARLYFEERSKGRSCRNATPVGSQAGGSLQSIAGTMIDSATENTGSLVLNM